jgi:hypothetical protein
VTRVKGYRNQCVELLSAIETGFLSFCYSMLFILLFLLDLAGQRAVWLAALGVITLLSRYFRLALPYFCFVKSWFSFVTIFNM